MLTVSRLWARISAALPVLTVAFLGACQSASEAPGPPAEEVGNAEAADGNDGTPDAEPAGPWSTPFSWKLSDAVACPAKIDDGDLLKKLVGDLGLTLPLGIPKSFYDKLGGRLAADPTRLDHFHVLQADVSKLPCFAGNIALRADAALAGDHPMASMLADMATQLDQSITVGGPWRALDSAAPLLGALDALNDGVDWPREAAAAAVVKVPLGVQRAAARLLFAALEARAMRDEGLAMLVDASNLEAVFERGTDAWLPSGRPGLDPDATAFSKLFRKGDRGAGRLYEGAIRVAQAIDEVDWKAATTSERFELFAPTPMGAVLLRGGGDDVYDPTGDPRLSRDLLLVMDTGGNDTYRIAAGATTSLSNPVSMLVDLAGDDTYGYVEKPGPYDRTGLLPSDAGGRYAGDAYFGPYSLSRAARQGAGLLGYGFLVDRGGGKDSYRSHRASQGFASFGVGVLWDDGGDDRYEAENGAQGSALVGLALLHDGGGNDTYRSFYSSQGFGWVASFGALYDAAGDDRYEMVVDDVLLFPSVQTPKVANASLGQGTAFGWRRDSNGKHFAGGLALLRDRRGNDRYDGANFVQGTGYLMGLGILADAEGDDRYNGLFYAQGAGAHYALAAFLEGAGNDHYNEDRRAIHSSIGLAHDFSVVFFVDDAGNDRYFGPDRSIGASKCHGLGVFVDRAGDDHYEVTIDRAIGWATDYDWAIHTCGTSTTTPSYGLFVDVDGTDEYLKPDAKAYGDDKAWITKDPVDPAALQLSGGVDATKGKSFAWAYGASWSATAK